MAIRKTQVVHDEWETYAAETEDGLLFVSFDVEAARDDLTETLQHCARILIPIHEPNENGGPAEAENEAIYAMEDDLCAALADSGVDCRLVGRLTCAGVRELVFQLDDWESFRPIVGKWMGENPGYEIDVSEHESWEFFNDVIRPTEEIWLYLADRSLVDNLLEAGSDPNKEHTIEFVFNGHASDLKKVLQSLEARGYTAPNGINEESEEMIAVKTMKLDVDAIFEETLANQQLAEEHEAVYDGWGTMIVE